MQNEYFKKLEQFIDGSEINLSKVLDNLVFNQQGLIPVITQDAGSKMVLMLAWMNKAALEKTLDTGRMTYWSRSRQNLWTKGETSGHFQQLVSMSFDCDGDSILCQVQQIGAACHTNRKNCFYLNINRKKNTICIQ